MANTTTYPPYPQPIAEKQDLRVTREWLLFFQALSNAVNVIGSGEVTHTGNLTLNQVILGNGGADIKALGAYGTSGQVLISQGTGLAPVFQSLTAAGVAVPYFIASGDTFTVPLNIQSVFSMTIDNEGIIDVDGFLIQVD